MRLILFIILGGGFLSVNGYQEYIVSSKTKNTPSATKLVDIEKGNKITNNYLILDEHWAFYSSCVYYYKTSKYDKEVKDSSTVEYAYYPALSIEHPYIIQLGKLEEKYGDLSKVPEGQFPKLENIDVLIKTEKFKTVGDIPAYIDTKKNMTGLVINSINSLNDDEKRLIQESFPKVNFNKVVIIEEGREPSSTTSSFAMMGGGVFIIFIGIAVAFKGRD